MSNQRCITEDSHPVTQIKDFDCGCKYSTQFETTRYKQKYDQCIREPNISMRQIYSN